MSNAKFSAAFTKLRTKAGSKAKKRLARAKQKWLDSIGAPERVSIAHHHRTKKRSDSSDFWAKNRKSK